MTDSERRILKDLLGLIERGIFPGRGAERDALVERARAKLDEPVVTIHVSPHVPEGRMVVIPGPPPSGWMRH